MKQFKIKEDFENWRLRIYSTFDKTGKETFTGKESLPLCEHELKD